MNCSELASQLSGNYRNLERQGWTQKKGGESSGSEPQPAVSSSSFLTQYLSTHGLLLTMCFPWKCTLPLGSSHISGSWIHSSEQIGGGGVQVIPSQSHVGLILDPSKVQIRCAYPTDAVSNERQDQGCGPMKLDPHHPGQDDQEAIKKELRALILNYKNWNFGVETPWDSIDCTNFLPLASLRVKPSHWPFAWEFKEDSMNSQQSTESNQRNSSTSKNIDFAYVENIFAYDRKIYSSLMGHSLCNVSSIPDKNRDDEQPQYGDFFMYTGAYSWNATFDSFQSMVDLQHQFIQQSNNNKPNYIVDSDRMWNEVVMAMPETQLQDAVLGVFYLEDATPATRTTTRRSNIEEGAIATTLNNEGFCFCSTPPSTYNNNAQSIPARIVQARDQARIWGGKPVFCMKRRIPQQEPSRESTTTKRRNAQSNEDGDDDDDYDKKTDSDLLICHSEDQPPNSH